MIFYYEQFSNKDVVCYPWWTQWRSSK